MPKHVTAGDAGGRRCVVVNPEQRMLLFYVHNNIHKKTFHSNSPIFSQPNYDCLDLEQDATFHERL